MKKIIVIILLVVFAFEAKVRGVLVRHSPSEAQMIVAPSSTPTLSDTLTPASVIMDAPQCVIDWSLPVSDDNARAILSCYKALYPYPTRGPLLCPPAFSEWEVVFSSGECWAQNHGTPAALTATAIGPLPIPTATATTAYP